MNQIEVRMVWTEPGSYDDAQDFFHCVYIHEKDGRIFYVGEANTSSFGGYGRRKICKDGKWDGEMRNPRYQSSYRHWIDALLSTGSRLFIGEVEDTGRVTEVERHLRWQLQPELDRDRSNPPKESPNQITHLGDVPLFLSLDVQADA